MMKEAQEQQEQSLNDSSSRYNAILYVIIHNGRNLRDMDFFSKNDTYVKVKVGENVSRSDVHDEAGKACEFNWSVQFPFRCDDNDNYYDSNDSNRNTNEFLDMTIAVYDEDVGTKDDKIGTVVVPYKEILQHNESSDAFRGRLELRYKSKLKRISSWGGCNSDPTKYAGEVTVTYYWETKTIPSSGDTPRRSMLSPPRHPLLVFPTPVLCLEENYSYGKGLLSLVVDGGTEGNPNTNFSVTPFHTWQIRLWDVNAIFENLVCPWNEEYHAAQQIYGPTVSAGIIRKGIRLQHAALYRAEKKYQRLRLNKLKLLGRNHDALGDLLQRIPQKQGIRFTYVILPDGTMNFSVTSKKIVQDFLSKHALHANAAPSVVFAGEFYLDYTNTTPIPTTDDDTSVGTIWFSGSIRLPSATTLATTTSNDNNGNDSNNQSQQEQLPPPRCLVIDNNSGTFAPPKEYLPNLAILLQRNFGTDLPILALDREDELLKTLSEQNHIA